MATTQHTAGGGHHITPISTYVKTILALVVLMALTVYVAVYIVLPDVQVGPVLIRGVWMNNVIALLIAAIKAVLVVLFFMGIKYSSNLARIWAAAGFLVFTLMFFILADNFSRVYEPAPSWDGHPDSALNRQILPLEEKLPKDVDINVRPRQ